MLPHSRPHPLCAPPSAAAGSSPRAAEGPLRPASKGGRSAARRRHLGEGRARDLHCVGVAEVAPVAARARVAVSVTRAGVRHRRCRQGGRAGRHLVGCQKEKPSPSVAAIRRSHSDWPSRPSSTWPSSGAATRRSDTWHAAPCPHSVSGWPGRA